MAPMNDGTRARKVSCAVIDGYDRIAKQMALETFDTRLLELIDYVQLYGCIVHLFMISGSQTANEKIEKLCVYR